MSKTIHGMYGTPEYRSWQHMKSRCFNPNHKNYLDYGGRGIKVCDLWLNFENFLADMGLKPTAKYSIDRIDNDGDYCPDNCKWSTQKEQSNNRRSNRFITIKNETLTMAQWAEKMGIDKQLIFRRLSYKWSEFDAVMTPVHTVKLITIDFTTLKIVEWENKMGFKRMTIQNRLNRGWSEFDAVMTPIKQRKSA